MAEAEIELADEFIKNKHETGADVMAGATYTDIKTSLRERRRGGVTRGNVSLDKILHPQ